MSGLTSGGKRARRSSVTLAVPSVTLRRRSDGTYHRSVTEQLAFDIDVPARGPHLVVAFDDADTIPGLTSQPSTASVPLAELGDVLAQVLEFHEAFDLPREAEPTAHVGDTLGQLRVSLLREEVEEFADATEKRDLIAIADALADVVYVAYGSAVTYGIDLDAVVREVHRSNMSKLDSNGLPVLREDGKVLKSERYLPPNIGQVIETQLPLFDTEPPGSGDATPAGTAAV